MYETNKLNSKALNPEAVKQTQTKVIYGFVYHPNVRLDLTQKAD